MLEYAAGQRAPAHSGRLFRGQIAARQKPAIAKPLCMDVMPQEEQAVCKLPSPLIVPEQLISSSAQMQLLPYHFICP